MGTSRSILLSKLISVSIYTSISTRIRAGIFLAGSACYLHYLENVVPNTIGKMLIITVQISFPQFLPDAAYCMVS